MTIFDIPHAALKVTRLHDDVKLPRKATTEYIRTHVYAYLNT
jgi:hypothetical protein